jgi:hypothetical protein
MAAPHTANDEQVIANGLAQAMGKTGAPRIYTIGSPSPEFPISAIYMLQDSVFFSITVDVYENNAIYNTGEGMELYVDNSGENENVQVVSFLAGSIIRGNIRSFNLDGGAILVYPA